MHPRIASVLITAAAATSLLTAPPARASLLYSNGGMITNPGAGFNGADVSQCSSDVGSRGLNSGSNPGIGLYRLITDDFVVPAGGWYITSITGYAQVTTTTGFPYPYPPTSTLTGATFNLYNGTVSLSNQTPFFTSSTMTDNSWTGIYRTLNGAANLTNTLCPIMAVTVDFGGLFLPAGTYGIGLTFYGAGPQGGTSTAQSPLVMTVNGSGLPVTSTGNLATMSSTDFTGNPGSYNYVPQLTARGGVSLPFLVTGSVPTPGAAALLGMGVLASSRRRRV